MYEYEKNIINNNEDYLKKIDIIENFSGNTVYLNTVCLEILKEDEINSPLIEGNQLTKTEAQFYLENDVTVRGKKLKDFIQIQNQRHVNTEILEKIIYNCNDFILDINTILDIHRIITYGELPYNECGQLRDDIVTLATTIKIPPEPEKVPILLDQLIKEYYKPLDIGETQFERICEFKRNFELIHPFFDGNGRTGRVLMNALFIQNNYPVITIPYEERINYFNSLETNTFPDFCANLMLNSIYKIQMYEKKQEFFQIIEDFDYD